MSVITVSEKKNIVEVELIKDNIIISGETTLDEQINAIKKETPSNLIDIILLKIPKKNALAKKDIIQKISEQSKYGVRELQARYKELQEIKYSKIIEIDLTKESVLLYAEDDKFDIGEIKEIIKFNYGYILDTTKGIFQYDKLGKFHEILLKPIDIIFKTKDVNLGNIDCFTFYFGESRFRNLTLRQSLKALESKTLKISELGRDILKKYFDHQSSKEFFVTRKAKYILGWDNGWDLPITEDYKNITLITHTSIQELIYQNAKNIIKKYNEPEKKDIKRKLKKFIELTQTDPLKHAIIIGWSIASPFKLYFINKFQLFVLDYLCGLRETGKTHLALFYVVYFYNVHKNYFSESILNNKSHLEDYMASSTFPIFFSEFTKVYSHIIDVIKESCTGVSNMSKKLPDQLLKVNKPKTAAIMLDSNKPIVGIDNAMNTKMNFQNFDIEDKIDYDPNWVDLFNELKGESLYSFIYDFTKDWRDKDIDIFIDGIMEEYKEEYLQAQKEDSRLAKTFISIMFGIKLFEDVFDIVLEKKEIIDLLIIGRTYISNELLDSFQNYCMECIHYADDKRDYEYDLETALTADKPYSVANPLMNYPSYLKYGLTLNSKGKYIFTTTHLNGFNRSHRNYDYKLKEIYNLLKDSIEDKGLLQYNDKSKYSIDIKGVGKAIEIEESFIKIEIKNKLG
ncbi:hypothetical protein LCGC14_1160970 [marine sediment metagenome]|uniref:DUF927 domain-containing protein n=1 Tax=marine sediment metagenome TaxID=412755 RepID=A0A0F9LXM0_9ZZZZ